MAAVSIDVSSSAAASDRLKPMQCHTAEAAVRLFFEKLGAVDGEDIKLEGGPCTRDMTVASFRKALQIDADFAPMVQRFGREALTSSALLEIVENCSKQKKLSTGNGGILVQAFKEAIELLAPPNDGCLEYLYNYLASWYVQMRHALLRLPGMGIVFLFVTNSILCLVATLFTIVTFGLALSAFCAIKNKIDERSRVK